MSYVFQSGRGMVAVLFRTLTYNARLLSTQILFCCKFPLIKTQHSRSFASILHKLFIVSLSFFLEQLSCSKFRIPLQYLSTDKEEESFFLLAVTSSILTPLPEDHI